MGDGGAGPAPVGDGGAGPAPLGEAGAPLPAGEAGPLPAGEAGEPGAPTGDAGEPGAGAPVAPGVGMVIDSDGAVLLDGLDGDAGIMGAPEPVGLLGLLGEPVFVGKVISTVVTGTAESPFWSLLFKISENTMAIEPLTMYTKQVNRPFKKNGQRLR